MRYRLLERLSYRYTFIRVTRAMEKVLPEQMYSKDAEAKADFTTRVLNTAVTATVSQCAAVVICHPFRLLGVRLIGQLIGGPQIYKPFGWYAVLQTEGVGGLYRCVARQCALCRGRGRGGKGATT